MARSIEKIVPGYTTTLPTKSLSPCVLAAEAAGSPRTTAGDRSPPRRLSAVLCDARVQTEGKRNLATIPPRTRREVLARDGHTCRMKGCHRSHFLEVHHIKPRAKGGTNDKRNLITLCSGCHQVTHDMDPSRTAQVVRDRLRRETLCPYAGRASARGPRERQSEPKDRPVDGPGERYRRKGTLPGTGRDDFVPGYTKLRLAFG